MKGTQREGETEVESWTRTFSRRDFLKASSVKLAGAALWGAGGAGVLTGCAEEEKDAAKSPGSTGQKRQEASANSAGDDGSGDSIAGSFVRLTRETEWRRVDAIPVAFRTYHPQGMARVGDRFFLSSVEVLVEPEEYEESQNGYDRSAGKGVGHLFEVGLEGELIDRLRLGEDTIYHPGGIDYDGRHIWVPVAEYRPDSRSIVYRVDPETLEATEVFRFPDHIGGIVRNTEANTLHGVSWGSRRLYRWTLDDSLNVTDADRPPEELRTLNKEHYIDYQDCQYLGNNMALCSGVVIYEPPQGPEFYLGGIDLVDLKTATPVHQIPVMLWTESGLAMTLNPFFVEENRGNLRFYFMPEDNESRLFIYDAEI